MAQTIMVSPFLTSVNNTLPRTVVRSAYIGTFGTEQARHSTRPYKRPLFLGSLLILRIILPFITDLCCPSGVDTHQSNTERGRRSQSPSELLIPKNRSTGNLLAHAQKGTEKARIRFSFDAGLAASEYDTMSRLVVAASPWHLRGRRRMESMSRGSSLKPGETT